MEKVVFAKTLDYWWMKPMEAGCQEFNTKKNLAERCHNFDTVFGARCIITYKRWKKEVEKTLLGDKFWLHLSRVQNSSLFIYSERKTLWGRISPQCKTNDFLAPTSHYQNDWSQFRTLDPMS
jgi:hypothetical protein